MDSATIRNLYFLMKVSLACFEDQEMIIEDYDDELTSLDDDSDEFLIQKYSSVKGKIQQSQKEVQSLQIEGLLRGSRRLPDSERWNQFD